MAIPATVQAVTDSFLDEVDARLPGRLTGLFLHGSLCWGEFFDGSDVDFVGLWDRLPGGVDLQALEEAHLATRRRHPRTVFDGFHANAEDLAVPPSQVGPRPVFFRSHFTARGGLDINPVTWHELAERAVVVRGALPPIRCDREELRAYTAANLDDYWRGELVRVVADGPTVAGSAENVAWVTLGVARLRHLLDTGELTSKSGAGRYVLERLDQRWHRLATEALRVREHGPGDAQYDDPAVRGRDLIAFLAWALDGQRSPEPVRVETGSRS